MFNLGGIMARVSGLLDDNVVAIAKIELKKLGKYAYVSKKLQAVIAASEHGITDVAKVYNISRTTLTEWIKYVKKGAIDKLQAPPSRKKRSKLNDAHKLQIQEWVTNNPNLTIKELMIQIEEKLGIALSHSTTHRVIKSLNFSYITPRPKHYKQNPTLVEEFKKKSSNRS